MKTIDITGTSRPDLGKSNSKKVRNSGNVPCVIYGESEPAHVQIDHQQLFKMFHSPDTYLVNLNADGKSTRCVVREVQWHPVHDLILHVDFLRVTDDKPVEVSLPVRITGTSPGVLAGGKLSLLTRRLKVSGLLKNIPEAVSIDISALELGGTIKVSDLTIEGLTFTNPASLGIVSVNVPRAAREETTAAAAPAAAADKKAPAKK